MECVLQSESTECGLACLVMIARRHGHGCDLRSLRQRFGSAALGMTLRDLTQAAQALGLSSRALRLEPEDLPALQLPCILHWNLNHFVVLQRCDRRRAVILDPAQGRRRVGLEELSRHFSGVALELAPMPQFRAEPAPARLRLRSLVADPQGLSAALGRILLLALSLELLVLAGPLASQLIIDNVLNTGDGELLLLVVGVFSVLVLLQAAWAWLRAYWIRRLTQQITLEGQTLLFAHLLKLPASFFQARGAGELAVRFESAASLQRIFTQGMTVALVDGLMAVLVLGLMVLYAPSLALIVLGAVLLYALIRLFIDTELRRAAAERLTLAAREQGHFLETLRCITAIKLHDRTAERRSQWLQMAVDVANRDHRTAALLNSAQTLQTLIFGLEHLAVLAWGAHTILQGPAAALPAPLTVGMLVAFLAYRGQFVARVSALLDAISQWRLVRLHLDHLADIVLEPPEVQDSAAQPDLPAAGPKRPACPQRLELRGLGFRHPGSQTWLFRGLQESVEPGELVAIAGPSGVGKSTLVRIILGLLPPSEGQVLYGGVPIEHLGPPAYRRLIGAVLQDDSLLSGSVAENIALLDPEPDPAWVLECAARACLHESIRSLPMGYHTPVGEQGHWISGGQRQRLLLARALYKRPSLLVLDEATSHLDTDLEEQVNASVRALNLTRIVVAHRPQTLAAADRVIHLTPWLPAIPAAA